MFKRKIVKVLTLLFSVLIFISTLLIKDAFANVDNTFYIKNSYTVGAYLYEDDEGVLRYGIPLKNEQSFKWELITSEQGVLIKNVKSNNYITLKDFGGNNIDPVKILPLDEEDDRFYWNLDIEIESGISQNISSASEDYLGYVLHLEGISNGQVTAEKVSGENLGWGNVKWLLYKETEINFDAIIRDGFCILNNLSGDYIYLDESGRIKFGKPTSPDDAFIWVIEVNNDYKSIKNKKYGTYLSMTNFDEIKGTLNVVNNINNELDLWSFSISLETKIKSASNEYQNHAFSGNKEAIELKVKKYTSVSDDLKFSIVPAASVENAVGDLVLEDKIYNLKNAWFLMYLIEDNGQATYGNASPSDPYAQWRIKYDPETRTTALINVGSGHYLHPGEGENGLIVDSTVSYYWNLLRNKNDLYPDAVVFQDSQNLTYYLHMEAMNGFAENSNAVQPTWGTPHWIPISYDGSTPDNTFNLTEIDDKFIRIKSVYGKNQYLYETAAGGLAYGEVPTTDARSHWKFVKSENGYYLMNRRFENYFANMGNGVLRAFEKVEDISSGGEFILYTDETNSIYLIGNYYEGLKDYLIPYINISTLTGLARSTLVPIDAKTTKWIFEDAKDTSDENQESQLGNVNLTIFKDPNTSLLIHNSNYLDGKYVLEYQGNYVKINKKDTDLYLYHNNGKVEFAKINNPFDSRILFILTEKLGKTYLVNNELQLQVILENSNPTYLTLNSYKYDKHVTFTVFTLKSQEYQIKLDKEDDVTPTYYVNGINKGEYSESNNKVYLNKGINTIKVSDANKVTSLTVLNNVSNAYRGASVIYQTYEAEDMETNAEVLMEDTLYRTIQSESSGRSAVKLERTTHYVRFKLSEDTNALVIRYSIPDTKDGLGQEADLSLYINNQKQSPITMTSKYSHLYGAYPWSNDPKEGNEHVYYDEVRVLLDKTYKKGTEIKLQKDVSSYAEYYVIDLVEGYLIDEPLTKPENAVSITDFGAISNDGESDLNALITALSVANVSNKEVWIPEGVFNFEGLVSIDNDNTVIRGAGNFYTIIQGGVSFMINASNTSFYDFSLMGEAITRRDNIDKAAFEVKKSNASGLLIQNLWIVHYKCGFWLSHMDNIQIVGNKVRYTFADGLNLHAGVVNGFVEQNDFMSTGDDTIGLWSQGTSNLNIVIKHNTIRNPWLANGVGIYGGTNITVMDNIIKDTVYAGAGVNISTNFQPTSFTGSVKVLRNSIIRCGSENQNVTVGGIWFNTILGYDNKANNIIEDNLILNSSYQGISFGGGGRVNKVEMKNNLVLNSGTWGLEIAPSVNGTLVATNNLINRSMLDNYKSESNNFIADISVEYIKAKNKFKNEWDLTKLVTFILINIVLMNITVLSYLYVKKDQKRRSQ